MDDEDEHNESSLSGSSFLVSGSSMFMLTESRPLESRIMGFLLMLRLEADVVRVVLVLGHSFVDGGEFEWALALRKLNPNKKFAFFSAMNESSKFRKPVDGGGGDGDGSSFAWTFLSMESNFFQNEPLFGGATRSPAGRLNSISSWRSCPRLRVVFGLKRISLLPAAESIAMIDLVVRSIDADSGCDNLPNDDMDDDDTCRLLSPSDDS